MKTISKFDGDFRFLSNFHPCKVEMDGVEYSSTEHAYQAAKTLVPEERDKIKNAPSATHAKRAGKNIEVRPDWNEVKLSVMEDLLRKKFAIQELKELLLSTKDAELAEGNWWGDTFWGICKGKGENHLGKLLMKIRDELK